MSKIAVFTICAKNYMAQALSLKESCLENNPQVDFFIFLSDNASSPEIPSDVVTLDDSWIEAWKSMAFKYDVIEFSTAIKPFCINKLFEEGYDKVIYLDPDIYVFGSLDCVFNALDNKSIILTPHRCIPLMEFTGPVNEQVVSGVGIYNLGFLAIKNDSIGQTVVKWWINRLRDCCLIDNSRGMFVDQKWMDFIPGFFPNDTLISKHLGLNAAIWNIQERKLIWKDGRPFIENRENPNELYPLIFFHFSGFKPKNPGIIHPRYEGYDISNYPEMEVLLKKYAEAEIRNNYAKYSTLSYDFNNFSTGEPISKTIRRIYGKYLIAKTIDIDPFDSKNIVYKFFKGKNLLSKKQRHSITNYTETKKNALHKKIRKFISVIGIDRFENLQQRAINLGNLTPKYELD